MLRKYMIPLGMVFLLAILAACASGPPRSQDFTFVQISDPQIGMYMAFKEADDYTPELRDFARGVELVSDLAPEFIVITGDLVETWNNHTEIAHFMEFKAALEAHAPVHLQPGNHDMAPNPEGLEFYRRTYGPDRGVLEFEGCRFILLNSNLIAYTSLAAEEEEQWGWLVGELWNAREENARHIFVFQHHPFFLHEADEEDAYFNIPTAKRMRYLELFAEHGVTANFSGHYHREAGGFHKGTEYIVTSSLGYPLGDTPPGMRRVEVTADGYSHSFIPLP
ncbi:MAG: metallophosphoesterase [Candidatus Sumerlaeia bacterium]|nr:metallophosphoesterase [Candidatus Sumerlaeia bacterium]